MALSVSDQRFERALLPFERALLRRAGERAGASLADDVAQETRIRAWQLQARFHWDEASPAFGGWLFAILDNVADELLCRQAKSETLLPPDILFPLLDVLPSLPDLTPDRYAHFREELYTLLYRATLTPLQESCIRLWLDNHTQQQIADYYAISQQAVHRHIRRGIGHLRRASRRVEVSASAKELFLLMCDIVKYRRPQPTGAGLANAKLRRLK